MVRDNSIVYLLNYYGWNNTANAVNWLTTETSDIVILMLAGKIGITSIEGKMLAILIISFII